MYFNEQFLMELFDHRYCHKLGQFLVENCIFLGNILYVVVDIDF